MTSLMSSSTHYAVTHQQFQTIDILLEADKPALAEAIWKQLPLAVHNTVLPQNVLYVVDCGALLHRIPRNSGETCEGISSHYV